MFNTSIRKCKKVRILLLPTALITLTACSPMNSQFDCKKVGGEGAGCVSLDQVNQMANQGAFNQSTSSSPMNTSSVSNSPSTSFALGGTQGYPVQTPFAGQPIWHDGDKQQIWIAPFVDTDGNFHGASYVYFPINNGYWIGQPPTAIESDQD